jgi:regulator of protease activity HflC (stomatin/prohibitin superfamily)
VADATKYREIAVAEGEAQAIKNVFGAIHDGDPTNDLIAVKYLDALTAIADGKANKVFLPMEATGVMGSIAGVAELFKTKQDEKPARQGNEPESTG